MNWREPVIEPADKKNAGTRLTFAAESRAGGAVTTMNVATKSKTVKKPPAMPVNDAGIPEQLKNLLRWVCWQWTLRKDKWDKPPLQLNGRLASSTDSTTWTDYQTALAAHQSGKFDGIGIALGKVDSVGLSLAGVDLDDCRDPASGDIDPSAAYLLARLNSYSEISPSGTGIKALCWGNLPQGPHADHERGVELYDGGRYFCVTGNRLSDYPGEVMDRLAELADVHAELFSPATPTGSKERIPDSDLALHALNGLSPSRAVGYWNWLKVGMALHAVDPSPAILAEWDAWSAKHCPAKYQASVCAKKWASFKRGGLTLGSLLHWAQQDGWSPPWHHGGFLTNRNGHHLNSTTVNGGRKPTIVVSVKKDGEKPMTDAAIKALSFDLDLYIRDTAFCHIIELSQTEEEKKVTRSSGTYRIVVADEANIRERMSCVADWMQPTKKDPNKLVACWVPDRAVKNVIARRHYPGIRPLTGVVDYPVIRFDGSILTVPGYDKATGLIYKPGCHVPPIPEYPNPVDLAFAVSMLDQLVQDFPFASDTDKSVWIAALLTGLARFAFSGPVPLFAFDSNLPGAGKGLLIELVARILLGRPMPFSPFTEDKTEIKKILSAVIMAADPLFVSTTLIIPFPAWRLFSHAICTLAAFSA